MKWLTNATMDEARVDFWKGEEQGRKIERIRQDYGLGDFLELDIRADQMAWISEKLITGLVGVINETKKQINELYQRKLSGPTLIDVEIKVLQDELAEVLGDVAKAIFSEKQLEKLKIDYIEEIIFNGLEDSLGV
uniref:Uncharacterized protein n=1 Tax=viral metagenome TaxID=1070528 RepID=A0A6M3JRJ2_9ZZZZ